MINKIYKSILITGAADGIGFNLLQRLYQENLKSTFVQTHEQMSGMSRQPN